MTEENNRTLRTRGRSDAGLTPELTDALEELAARWLEFADDASEAILDFEVSCAIDQLDLQLARRARLGLDETTKRLAEWLPIPQPVRRRKFG